MKKEVLAASVFVIKLLRTHSNLSKEGLELFCSSLSIVLLDHYKDHWFTENPNRGSGFRCLRNNHSVDPLLLKAGRACGLSREQLSSWLPDELTVWVDPGSVSYRIGEHGSICVVVGSPPERNPSPQGRSQRYGRNSPPTVTDYSPEKLYYPVYDAAIRSCNNQVLFTERAKNVPSPMTAYVSS